MVAGSAPSDGDKVWTAPRSRDSAAVAAASTDPADPTFAVRGGLGNSAGWPFPQRSQRMTYRPTALFVVALIALFWSGAWAGCPVARADVAVMVPPHAEQLASPELLDQALEELMRLLRVQGFNPVSSGQAGPAAEGEQQRGGFPLSYDPLHCLTPECANEYRKLFDGAFAVQLSIASRGLRASSVSVVLTENPKAFFSASSPIEGRDIRAAVRAAFEAARAKQEEGAGPWLTVTGTPAGAMVYVDGAEYGRLPFTKRHVDAGAHRFEVRSDAYITEIRTLNVAGKVDHIETVPVALKPLAPAAGKHAGSQRGARRRSAWDWVLGGTIAAAGAVHLAAGIIQKDKAGDCVDDSSPCDEHYEDNDKREKLLIGVGAAGVALGALVIGLGPIGQLQVSSGSDRALFSLKGRF